MKAFLQTLLFWAFMAAFAGVLYLVAKQEGARREDAAAEYAKNCRDAGGVPHVRPDSPYVCFLRK